MKESRVQNKFMYIWKCTYDGECILNQSEKVDYSINSLILCEARLLDIYQYMKKYQCKKTKK